MTIGKGNSEYLNIRIPVGDLKAAKQAAENAGLMLSQFVRAALRLHSGGTMALDFAAQLDKPGGFRLRIFGDAFNGWGASGWCVGVEQDTFTFVPDAAPGQQWHVIFVHVQMWQLLDEKGKSK
ncbi:hypothetical protein LCGC14_1322660 [marine sediment metagenome]|uniref:Uncharacterized protein n=1 Tax=marine sediment metagenome TaxID=412755 RepID=A0A0F9KJI3_9ZZZZ